MREIKIRPEQAALLLKLHAEMEAAKVRFQLALEAATVGLAKGQVLTISEDGTVKLKEDKEEEVPDAAPV